MTRSERLLFPWRCIWAVPFYIGRAIAAASMFFMWGPREAKKVWELDWA